MVSSGPQKGMRVDKRTKRSATTESKEAVEDLEGEGMDSRTVTEQDGTFRSQ